jgi:hypothetical protein
VQRYARQEYDQSGHPIYSFHLDVIHFAIAPGYGVDKKSLTNHNIKSKRLIQNHSACFAWKCRRNQTNKKQQPGQVPDFVQSCCFACSEIF